MTRKISDLMQQHSRQLEDDLPWIWLYEIQAPTDPPTRYRLTNYTRVVAFGTDSNGDPIEYQPFPIVQGEVEESAESDLPKVQVQIGNETLEVLSLIDSVDGFEGQPVVIRLVNVDELQNPSAQARFDGEIVGTKAKHGRIAFDISAQNLYRARYPVRRFVRGHCNYQYGGSKCGYDLSNATLLAAFPRCLRTYEACSDHGDAEVAASLERQHPERFGGWLSIPRRRRR